MSTIEDNKTVARRWFDLVTQGRVEDLCAMTAPTWTMHGGPPALPQGPDGIRALFRTFGRIDQTWTIEDVIAEGDKVVSRYTSVATDTEGFMGRLPTGKVIRTPAIQIFRFSGGKIVESWAVRDDLKTLRQLGHVPLPETKPPAASPR